MKLIGIIGVALGTVGPLWLLTIGLMDVQNFSANSSEYHNGQLFIRYGCMFTLIFMATLWLMIKQYWKRSMLIGLLCTAFSVLGLFSIGPFLIWGSLFIFLFSFVNWARTKAETK
jgi:hypothetical protein